MLSPSCSPAFLIFTSILAIISAFCCAFSSAQADPRLEDDFVLRNLLLRQFMDRQMVVPVVTIEEGEMSPSEAVDTASSHWRERRTPAERAKLFRLSDQYTPTPCRWKLCASIFKGFQERK